MIIVCLNRNEMHEHVISKERPGSYHVMMTPSRCRLDLQGWIAGK